MLRTSRLDTTVGRLTAGLTVLCALAMLPGDPARAAAGACNADAAPVDLQVTVEPTRPRILNDRSQPEIHAMLHGGKLASTKGGDWRTVGLTRAELAMHTAARSRLRKAGQGFCVDVTSLQVRLRYSDMTVFIPESYRKGSCEYEAVLEHERQHVQVNEEVLQAFADDFRKKARAIVEDINPIYVKTERQAREMPLEIVNRRFEPLMKEFRATQDRRNAALDTESEYRRVQERCGAW